MQNWKIGKIGEQEMKLAPEYEQLLREQTIGEDGPGTILRDFEALLSYVDEHHPAVTPKRRLLSLSSLPEINERLTRPLELGLKRPVQKSYPPIHGLYLLIRASSLTWIEDDNLVVDEVAAQIWADLNPTERYFTLLEIWLLWSNPEIVGERKGLGLGEGFSEWKRFAGRIPEEGLAIAGTSAEEMLTYTPGLHNLGLLYLFGLIEVQDTHSEPGEGWHIKRVERTFFGDALLDLLWIEFFEDIGNVLKLESEHSISFGVFQPFIRPYFPDWEKNLRISEGDEFQEGVHVFKVSLGRIWRRIAIPADRPLESLVSAILDAVEFDRDHLYQFTYRNRFGASEAVNHPYMDEGPWTDEVRVGELPLGTGQTMTFVFDFGDWWEFKVELERVEPVEEFPELEYAVVLDEHGKAPDQYRSWA